MGEPAIPGAMSPLGTPGEFAADEIEGARLLFAQQAEFLLGVVRVEQIPESDVPEIAFAGRSNVGKSSLLNALLGRRGLARTSNTPGRTREINFFALDGRLTLVDLPGYGYARVSKNQVEGWTRLVNLYLKGRVELRRTLLLIDARHGLKDSDRSAMTMLDEAAQPYQIVLTKCDKVKAEPLARRCEDIAAELAKHGAAHPHVAMTSSRTGDGIPELRATLSALAIPAQRG